jgi:hypothetical protein
VPSVVANAPMNAPRTKCVAPSQEPNSWLRRTLCTVVLRLPTITIAMS